MKKIKSVSVVVLVLAVLLFGSLLHPFSKVQADPSDVFTGVRLSRDSNYVSYNNIAFPFNYKKFGLDSMWSSSDPTKIQIPITGAWMVGYDMTALGTLYSCGIGIAPISSERAIYEVVKNWCGNEDTCPHLHSDILFNRFEPQNGIGANGNSASTVVSLQQGDYLQMITTGKYPGPNGKPAVCVESNWGNTGTLSPSMWAIFLGVLQ